jgi:hypothetical protein
MLFTVPEAVELQVFHLHAQKMKKKMNHQYHSWAMGIIKLN